MRDRLFEASRAAAATIGYRGAGTVEFLADDNGEFYFLEMNTRLQVEHPVTEATTGLDLVELQLQIADGLRLPTDPPTVRGHSIEARLYAEDPAKDWRPQAGSVHRFRLPGASSAFESKGRQGIRLDSGIQDGSAVSIHYDPMLAKVIAHGPTRRQAAMLLADALARGEIHGIRTNRDLLVNILRHRAFLEGQTDTAFFATHGLALLSTPLADAAVRAMSAVAAALAEASHNRGAATAFPAIPSGWRNLASGNQIKVYRDDDGKEHRVAYRYTRAGLTLPGQAGVGLISAASDQVILADDSGVETCYAIHRYGDSVYVDSPLGSVTLLAVPRFAEPGGTAPTGSLLAPIPGVVIRMGAQRGDTVTAGQPLLWLEAMKMEHVIAAPHDGVLTELRVEVGTQVDVGAVVAFVGESGPGDDSQ
ncbi:biotin/lipoyl-containing protein [[Mycobacterium] zoologicum]|uniref:ATP-binding protein n=1 Tax=[Mycobacterium] zoologicum TaxID=2872311 RepID=UPI001CD72562